MNSVKGIRRFIAAIGRDWTTKLTGAVSIPLAVVALYADTSTQRAAWAAVAISALVVSSYRVWHAENRRADAAESALSARPRPWVIIDGYDLATQIDNDTGQEYDVETLHLVNRGEATAINIEIPAVRISGGTTRIFRQPPTLAPGDSTSVQIYGLRMLLEVLRRNVVRSTGTPGSVSVPLEVRYKDLAQDGWDTTHAVSFGGSFVIFRVIRPGDACEWTETLESRPAASA